MHVCIHAYVYIHIRLYTCIHIYRISRNAVFSSPFRGCQEPTLTRSRLMQESPRLGQPGGCSPGMPGAQACSPGVLREPKQILIQLPCSKAEAFHQTFAKTYVYIYIYIYIHVYRTIHTYIYIYVCMYTIINILKYNTYNIYTYVYTYMCIYV